MKDILRQAAIDEIRTWQKYYVPHSRIINPDHADTIARECNEAAEYCADLLRIVDQLREQPDVETLNIIQAMQLENEELEAQLDEAHNLREKFNKLMHTAKMELSQVHAMKPNDWRDKWQAAEAQLEAVRSKVIDFQKGGWQLGHGREGTVMWICTELLGLFDNEN